MLSLDIIVHIHQITDGLDIVGDVGISADGVFDHAAGHRKIHHVHGLVIVHHGVDQTAGKGVSAAHTIQDVKGEQFTLEGVVFIPQKCF